MGSLPWIKFPTAIMDDRKFPRLDGFCITVLMALLAMKGPDGVRPSHSTLSRKCRTSPDTVQRSLRKLNAEGLVKIMDRGNGRQCGYDLSAVEALIAGADLPLTAAGADSDLPLTAVEPTADSGTTVTGDRSSVRSVGIMAGHDRARERAGGTAVSCGQLPIDATPGIDTGDPTSPGPTADSGRSERRLLPEVKYPGDAEARYQIDQHVNGVADTLKVETVHGKMLDALVQEFGMLRCWEQAMVFPARIALSQKKIPNPAGYFVKSVRTNFSRPAGYVSLEDFREQFGPHNEDCTCDKCLDLPWDAT